MPEVLPDPSITLGAGGCIAYALAAIGLLGPSNAEAIAQLDASIAPVLAHAQAQGFFLFFISSHKTKSLF